MAQQGKVLAHKHDDISLIPKTDMEGEANSATCSLTYTYTTHTHNNKCNKVILNNTQQCNYKLYNVY